MQTQYPEVYEHVKTLSEKLGGEAPKLMSAFGRLETAATAPGALSTKTKELIALAIAITVRCNGCISYHVRHAMEADATRKEILETIGVALLMGGGPSMVYGCQAYEALGQFESADGIQEHSIK
jgi:AhpD family alkylhydroperoxidase